jgi:hypothetical protein
VKKKLLVVLLVLLALLVSYLLFNQIDAKLVPVDFESVTVTEKDFDKDNGFYRLWSLSEADDVDIEAGEIFAKYRKLGDPSMGIDANFLAHNANRAQGYLKSGRAKIKQLEARIPDRGKSWYNHPTDNNRDWFETIQEKSNEIGIAKEVLNVWLQRYQKLIDAKIFKDFTPYRFDAPIPNLLAWLVTAKVYNVIHMQDALNGNWRQAVEKILSHIDFGKRTQSDSLVLITNLVGKAVTASSLYSLAAIMNHKDCPEDVYRQILDRLPPIQYEEFGCSRSFHGEGLFFPSVLYNNVDNDGFEASFGERILKFLLLQKNRTYNYHAKMIQRLLKFETTLPHKWTEPLTMPSNLATGWFWWLQNPMGKIWLDNMNYNVLANTIKKSYRLKAYYDIVRISAELHLKYIQNPTNLPVAAMLSELESYNTLDPCSGKSYRWDEQKQVLYSIGTDREDDGGIEDLKTLEKDFVLPCILYVKQ